MMNDNSKRFSNRVEDYVKYRPGYPAALVDYLHSKWNLSGSAVVADIGSGTGISSNLFLQRGHPVFAIEPNQAMREKSIELLGANTAFSALQGTAESTGLQSGSIDLIVAGQAFHWFNRMRTKEEFRRVAKLPGIVALVWNERQTQNSFAADYDKLVMKHAIDYSKVDHRNVTVGEITQFFSPHEYAFEVFSNSQTFDFDGLIGRLASASYMPARDTRAFREMELDFYLLFRQYESGGMVTILYDTKVYSGRIN